MSLIKIGKEMILLAALRGAMLALAVIGRELALSEAERRAIVERVQAAILGPAAA